MWVSLNSHNLVEVYKKGFSSEEVSTQICLLLEELSKKTYAEKLSAVTSVGNLYLTGAISWDEKYNGGTISISEKTDSNKEVLVISYHTNSPNKSKVWHQGSLNEIVDYIDLYVMRLLAENYSSVEV